MQTGGKFGCNVLRSIAQGEFFGGVAREHVERTALIAERNASIYLRRRKQTTAYLSVAHTAVWKSGWPLENHNVCSSYTIFGGVEYILLWSKHNHSVSAPMDGSGKTQLHHTILCYTPLQYSRLPWKGWACSRLPIRRNHPCIAVSRRRVSAPIFIFLVSATSSFPAPSNL